MLSHITAVVGILNKYIYTRVCNWLYERYTSLSAFKSCMCDWRLRVVSGVFWSRWLQKMSISHNPPHW